MLVGQIRVFIDAHKRTASKFEIFNHELSESIFRVVHLIIKYESQVETLPNEGHELVNPISIDVAQHTLRVEQSWHSWIDFMLLYGTFEIVQIG